MVPYEYTSEFFCLKFILIEKSKTIRLYFNINVYEIWVEPIKIRERGAVCPACCFGQLWNYIKRYGILFYVVENDKSVFDEEDNNEY